MAHGVYTDVAEDDRLTLCRNALLLIPDVNRAAVYQLLTFLHHVSQQSEHNQARSLLHPTQGANTSNFCTTPPSSSPDNRLPIVH